MGFDDEYSQARGKASGWWARRSKVERVLIYVAIAIVVFGIIGWAVGAGALRP